MDKVYFNGKLVNKNACSITIRNRGFQYGDSFFETIRCYIGEPLFLEYHYFRMAGSFFQMKMNPPENFSIDTIRTMIKELLVKNNLDTTSARVRISLYRDCEDGYYLPKNNNIGFFIESQPLHQNSFQINSNGLDVGIYRDNMIANNHLSQLKSNNRLLNVLASIYAEENKYDDVLLLNTENKIIETTKGNLFIVKDNVIYTPPLEDGCVNGVLRKVLLTDSPFKIIEKSILFADCLNADEIFITNVIIGIYWVQKINHNQYQRKKSQKILNFLNTSFLI